MSHRLVVLGADAKQANTSRAFTLSTLCACVVDLLLMLRLSRLPLRQVLGQVLGQMLG
jgi:hypothetical protein